MDQIKRKQHSTEVEHKQCCVLSVQLASQRFKTTPNLFPCWDEWTQ